MTAIYYGAKELLIHEPLLHEEIGIDNAAHAYDAD
jgi:hypothetical protein